MRKNKILKTFVAILLLISIETVSIAASTGIVNVETVRVREKATTNSDIVELVSIGDKIKITGEEGDWYKVKVGKVTGYIRKDLLTVDGKTVEVDTNKDNNEDNNNKPEENTDTNPNEVPDETQNSEEVPEEIQGETAGQETPKEETPEGDSQVSEEIPENENENNESNQNQDVTSINGDKTISTIKIAEGVSAGKKVQLSKETKIKILPLANSSNIVTLEANTEVTVLEVINKWCRIESGEYTGWVRIDQ